MANFQITPFGGAAENVQFNFTNLYLHQTCCGASPNQSTVIAGYLETKFGQTAVNNWAVYDGVHTTDAKLVAHAKGLHMNTVDFYDSFVIVFAGESVTSLRHAIDRRPTFGFKGSTLEVMGATIEGLVDNDWAIVGGTGEFEFARGVIERELRQETSVENIYKLTVRGICFMKSLPEPSRSGPWGDKNAGSSYDLTEKPWRLESVTVRYAGLIDGFSYSYLDQRGQKHTVGPWADGTGQNTQTFTLGPWEFLKEISGTFQANPSGIPEMNSIAFVTNVSTYGPFGPNPAKGTSFKFSVDEVKKSCVVGFYATVGRFINSMGVYTV